MQKAQLTAIAIHARKALSNVRAWQLIKQNLGHKGRDPIVETQVLQAAVTQGKTMTTSGRDQSQSHREISRFPVGFKNLAL